jgi:hypothetical protein
LAVATIRLRKSTRIRTPETSACRVEAGPEVRGLGLEVGVSAFTNVLRIPNLESLTSNL